MDQPSTPESWMRAPQYADGGFSRPIAGLIKFSIDLRPRTLFPPSSITEPVMDQLKTPGSWIRVPRYTDGGFYQPKAFLVKIPIDLRPRTGQIPDTPFGVDSLEGQLNTYVGGPILDRSTLKWRRNFYARACGDIFGAARQGCPLPLNMAQITRSTCTMASRLGNQSGIWVGPRILISTLHIHPWYSGYPSNAELGTLRDAHALFWFENEISNKFGSLVDSPLVEIIDWSIEYGLGIFKLKDGLPDVSDFIDPEWLMDRDFVRDRNLDPGRKVACVGYNSMIHSKDAKQVQYHVAGLAQRSLHTPSYGIESIDLDHVTKPGMKSFAPGTLDAQGYEEAHAVFGVSCSLWKGSNGGPCVMLDGEEAGGIIGLVQGHTDYPDPFNLINSFPVGLKETIKTLNGKKR